MTTLQKDDRCTDLFTILRRLSKGVSHHVYHSEMKKKKGLLISGLLPDQEMGDESMVSGMEPSGAAPGAVGAAAQAE